jgi:hypothetical protein
MVGDGQIEGNRFSKQILTKPVFSSERGRVLAENGVGRGRGGPLLGYGGRALVEVVDEIGVWTEVR